MKGRELAACLQKIEKVVGTRWLHDQVHMIRSAVPRYGIGVSPGNNGMHPLALAWFGAREELILSEITGVASFSGSALRTAVLGENIQTVKTMEGFEAQKNRLLDLSLFHKAALEVSIAAGYVRSGRLVSFTDPGFRILLAEGSVSVECFSAIKDETDSFLEQALLQGKVCSAPSIVYIQLTLEQYNSLRGHFDHTAGQIRGLLTGKAYCALVTISPAAAVFSQGRIKTGMEGFTVMNPAPRIRLPESFKIFYPYEPSSIS